MYPWNRGKDKNHHESRLWYSMYRIGLLNSGKSFEKSRKILSPSLDRWDLSGLLRAWFNSPTRNERKLKRSLLRFVYTFCATTRLSNYPNSILSECFYYFIYNIFIIIIIYYLCHPYIYLFIYCIYFLLWKL